MLVTAIVVALPMVLDTGASSVVLTQEAAKAAGLPLEVLNYSVQVDTANGRARAAPVTLDRLSVGGITERVRADLMEVAVVMAGAYGQLAAAAGVRSAAAGSVLLFGVAAAVTADPSKPIDKGWPAATTSN